MTLCWMSRCAIAALSSVLFGAAEDARPDHEAAPSGPGTPAKFAWGDINGDGKLELAAVGAGGALQLLASVGGDRFEDVSERLGLAGVRDAALALWVDYDADGRLDLFVGSRSGASRLFRNDGEVFVDMTAGTGLAIEGEVRSIDWLDHDGDGRLDLHVVTAEKNLLFQGREVGLFQRTELPLSAEALPSLADASPTEAALAGSRPAGDGDTDTAGGVRADRANDDGGDRGRAPAGPGAVVSPPVISVPNGGPREPVLICATEIRDQAMPSSCIQASSSPALGLLYPISANLFVAVSGNVGIGTTSPSARLHVAGTARVTNTLTLAPSGDQALNVSTGSIYKGGSLFIHTKGGLNNTAVGSTALTNVTSGVDNTAVGTTALLNTTSGNLNTAVGSSALRNNVVGGGNTALGAEALYSNTTGSSNTANGFSALYSNTTGQSNTASGRRALYYNTTGNFNTAIGAVALFNNTASNNTAIGSFALYDSISGDFNTATGTSALHRNLGSRNTASGALALYYNGSGSDNTAHGFKALVSNTTGNFNTACGRYALYYNTTGTYNTATGINALNHTTTASRNTAHGAQSLSYNTTGANNTASGFMALTNNTTGSRNIALGKDAGLNLTTGNDNIDIGNLGVAAESATIRIGTVGTQARAFIAGIHGVAIPGPISTVFINASGQLGTMMSSRRFKEDIADMGDRTDQLLELRPVVFRYKPEVQEGERPLEYGLIAEEVAEVLPDLVVYDEEGKPFTVKYHLLSSMLLNELKQQAQELEDQRIELARLQERLAAVEVQVAPAAAVAAELR